MLNVFEPNYDLSDLLAVKQVFDSKWTGKGKVTESFTQQFANYVGTTTEHITTINNCTEGLFLAMQLLNIGSTDQVILPSVSFVGAANAVLSVGAKPVFCDVDELTLNPTLQNIMDVVTPDTKAIIVLHFGGRPVTQWFMISKYAKEHNIYLIEDAALCIGASVQGKACGTLGDIGVWSFDAMKHLAIGTGGMIYCKSKKLLKRAKLLSCCGQDSASGYSNASATRWWQFNVDSDNTVGRNNLFDDIRAAIGITQLSKLDNNLSNRSVAATLYDQLLSDVSWLQLRPLDNVGKHSSNAFYWVQVMASDGTSFTRDQLALHMRNNNIYTTYRYYPLHRIKAYGHDKAVKLPATEWAADHTLLLPLHGNITVDNVKYICDTIKHYAI